MFGSRFFSISPSRVLSLFATSDPSEQSQRTCPGRLNSAVPGGAWRTSRRRSFPLVALAGQDLRRSGRRRLPGTSPIFRSRAQLDSTSGDPNPDFISRYRC
ncbi:hypothetical protein NL676_007967 [Syzygium grande]|nr:hypothetical protein NL676_007967 [Syzygium grande]